MSPEASRQSRARIRRLKERVKEIVLSPVRTFKAICMAVGFVTIVLLTTAAISVFAFLKSLPDVDQMKFVDLQKRARKRVVARLDNKKQLHRWVKINDINRDYLYAIVMSEDANFFEHNGFNYDALLNSLAENIKKREYVFGGSTISQQVAKNLFLDSKKSLLRKLKEILITRDLERRFKKNEILELYLNIAELGPDIYGARSAAAHFFGKSPSQINAAEGAFIALMLPSPRRNHYSIFQNKNLTKSKRRKIRRVLSDMLQNEFISAKQYQSYIRYDYFKRRNPASARGRRR